MKNKNLIFLVLGFGCLLGRTITENFVAIPHGVSLTLAIFSVVFSCIYTAKEFRTYNPKKM